MFVYLLIAFELALVYTVFWYLYLRNPQMKQRRIKGSQWGTYHNSPYTADGGDYYPIINNEKANKQSSGNPVETLPSFVSYQAEFVLNERTNRYVREERQAQSLLSKMAATVDSTLGQLNARN